MKNIQKDILDKITPSIKEEMESIWFTSDLHHAHNKIIEICNRPTTIEEHEDWLVNDVINKYVKRKDRLYLLGDISFAKRQEADKFIDRLNGQKYLILGNHDKSLSHSTRFQTISEKKNFNYSRDGVNIHIVLFHYPILSWERKIYGSWHLFGHVHGRLNGVGLSHDIGIDNLDNMWKPLNLYEICNLMTKKYQKNFLEISK